MPRRSRYQSPDPERHLKALGLSIYAVSFTAPLYEGPRHVMSLSKLLNQLDEVARRNEHAQQHVYIQGVEEDDHDLILIGPSWRPLTEELRAAGHDPAAVIQVGPEYFETWIRLGEQAPRAKRLIIAEYLNWFHGVSDGSQDAPRRGYLAGFEYRAQEGSLPNGHYPRVHLLEATGYIAPRGRLLVQMAEELREEMSAARARDLQEDLEVERAIAEVEATNRDAREQIAEFTRLWFVAYEDKMLGELSEIDQTAVEAAFAHDVPREITLEALKRVATRKGSRASAYAEETVAAVYDLAPDELSPDLEPS